MSEVFRHAMDLIYRNADLSADDGPEATYFAPGSTVGLPCFVQDENTTTLADIGGFGVRQKSRILSVYFPDGTEPVQGGTIATKTSSYRIAGAQPDDLYLTYSLDLEPQ